MGLSRQEKKKSALASVGKKGKKRWEEEACREEKRVMLESKGNQEIGPLDNGPLPPSDLVWPTGPTGPKAARQTRWGIFECRTAADKLSEGSSTVDHYCSTPRIAFSVPTTRYVV